MGRDVLGQGRGFDEGTVGAEGDDDVADSAVEEGDGGLFGGGEVGDGDSGEGGGFGLVWGEVVAEGVDGFGERGGWGGVEDREDSVRVGEAEAVLDDRAWEFELGDEDGRGSDKGSGLVDFGKGEFEARAGDDDDGVLAFDGVDEDAGGSGGVRGGEDELGVDAFGAVEGAGDLAEGVGAELGDEGDGGSGAGGSYGLIGAFAAGA